MLNFEERNFISALEVKNIINEELESVRAFEKKYNKNTIDVFWPYGSALDGEKKIWKDFFEDFLSKKGNIEMIKKFNKKALIGEDKNLIEEKIHQLDQKNDILLIYDTNKYFNPILRMCNFLGIFVYVFINRNTKKKLFLENEKNVFYIRSSSPKIEMLRNANTVILADENMEIDFISKFSNIREVI